jgi:WD40 repeat protein
MPLTGVAVAPTTSSTSLLTADSTLQLWSLAGTTHAPNATTFSGHASAVSAMAWSGDARFVATGAATDRFVQLWQMSGGAEDEKQQTRKAVGCGGCGATPLCHHSTARVCFESCVQIHTFAVDSPVSALHFNPFVSSADGSTTHHLCAVTDSSKLYIWQWTPPAPAAPPAPGKKAKAPKPGTTSEADCLVEVKVEGTSICETQNVCFGA